MISAMSNNISDHIKILSERISTEIDRISENNLNVKHSDSLLYIGNWQDAIPRSIWTDPDLDASDVRSWGVIRTQLQSNSISILSLNQLLHSSLDYSKATISKSIFILRLTRWISLCSRLRSNTGQFKGNIYAIHDSPVSINDASFLDGDYIGFIRRCTYHSNRAISSLSIKIINSPELMESNKSSQQDPSLQISNAFTRAGCLREKQNNTQKNHQVHLLNLVGIYTTTSCSSSIFNNKTTTTQPTVGNLTHARTRETSGAKQTCSDLDLLYPREISDEECEAAGKLLKDVPSDLRQKFLDELGGQIVGRRNTNNPVGNPIGWLSWLCQEFEKKGENRLTSRCVQYEKMRKQRAQSEKAMETAKLKADGKMNVSERKEKKRNTVSGKKMAKKLKESLGCLNGKRGFEAT